MPVEVLVLGAISGVGAGLAACGLILTYRASRVLNLAHGQIGILGALAFAAVVQRGWPYWPTLFLALAAGATIAAAVEVLVVRRLRRAPPPVTLVATLGVGQICLYAATEVAAGLIPSRPLPQPPGLPHLELPALTVQPSSMALLLVGVPVALGLTWLLSSTPLGMALRAAAHNSDGARLLGIPAPRLAAATWGAAGALAVLAAVFLLPTPGYAAAAAAGPGLLVTGLAAAALARMSSLPLALLAGIGVGVAQQVAIWHLPERGGAELVAFAILAAAVAARPDTLGRTGERGSWTAFERWAPPARGTLRRGRWAGPLLGGLALTAALALPSLVSQEDEVTLAVTAALALVALSVWVVTGLGGEVVLGQVAVAGVGALAGAAVGSPLLGVVAGAAAGAATAVAVGAAAVRTQGVAVAALSLVFAVAAAAWLFPQPWAFGGNGRLVEALAMGPVSLDTPGSVLQAAAMTLAVAVWLLSRLSRSDTALRMLASRDDEPTARAFGIRPAAERLRALAIGGALAGTGGVLLGHAVGRLTPGLFGVTLGIDVMAIAVLGGLAVATGPLVGALYVLAMPALLDLPALGLAATAAGWLAVVVLVPGGLVSLVAPLRRRLVGSTEQTPTRAPAGPLQRPPRTNTRSGAALEVAAVTKRFGGVTALDGVSLRVAPGEAVAVVGPNGAGKTTLVDVISGFARADAGRVVLGGRDVSALGPVARARLGLVRTFQNPLLFGTLTVEEVLRLARRGGGTPVDALIEMFGLEPWRDVPVRRLSTGTRRFVELAAAVGLNPASLVLDEPSAGVAQGELPPLRAVLGELRRELRLSLVVVDHDAALVEDLCDRVVQLDGGRRTDGVAPARLPALARADPPATREPLLHARGLVVDYGAAPVLAGVDLAAAPGEVVAVLGANGTGKSTLLRTLAGLQRSRAGRITLHGREVGALRPELRARAGVGLVAGGAAVFAPITVVDSLRLAALAADLRPSEAKPAIDGALAQFPELARRASVQAGALSGGEQHLLAIAQVLVQRPRALLIDELALGLAPGPLVRVVDAVRAAAERGAAVIFVDQSADVALAIAHRACLLDGGRVVFEGDPRELRSRPDLWRGRRLAQT